MTANEHINPECPYVKPSDTIDKTIGLMEEFKLTHLAVVYKDQFLGITEEKNLVNAVDYSTPISQLELSHKNIYIGSHQHIYDALNLAAQHKISIVPVLNNESYIGSIDIYEMLNIFSDFSTFQSEGGIIVLSLKQNDYSLSTIARITEESGLKILSSQVLQNSADPTYIELTLKLSSTDLTRLVASFERYDYQIIGTFQETIQDDIQDRLDNFFKYLNM